MINVQTKKNINVFQDDLDMILEGMGLENYPEDLIDDSDDLDNLLMAINSDRPVFKKRPVHRDLDDQIMVSDMQKSGPKLVQVNTVSDKQQTFESTADAKLSPQDTPVHAIPEANKHSDAPYYGTDMTMDLEDDFEALDEFNWLEDAHEKPLTMQESDTQSNKSDYLMDLKEGLEVEFNAMKDDFDDFEAFEAVDVLGAKPLSVPTAPTLAMQDAANDNAKETAATAASAPVSVSPATESLQQPTEAVSAKPHSESFAANDGVVNAMEEQKATPVAVDLARDFIQPEALQDDMDDFNFDDLLSDTDPAEGSTLISHEVPQTSEALKDFDIDADGIDYPALLDHAESSALLLPDPIKQLAMEEALSSVAEEHKSDIAGHIGDTNIVDALDAFDTPATHSNETELESDDAFNLETQFSAEEPFAFASDANVASDTTTNASSSTEDEASAFAMDFDEFSGLDDEFGDFGVADRAQLTSEAVDKAVVDTDVMAAPMSVEPEHSSTLTDLGDDLEFELIDDMEHTEDLPNFPDQLGVAGSLDGNHDILQDIAPVSFDITREDDDFSIADFAPANAAATAYSLDEVDDFNEVDSVDSGSEPVNNLLDKSDVVNHPITESLAKSDSTSQANPEVLSQINALWSAHNLVKEKLDNFVPLQEEANEANKMAQLDRQSKERKERKELLELIDSSSKKVPPLVYVAAGLSALSLLVGGGLLAFGTSTVSDVKTLKDQYTAVEQDLAVLKLGGAPAPNSAAAADNEAAVAAVAEQVKQIQAQLTSLDKTAQINELQATVASLTEDLHTGLKKAAVAAERAPVVVKPIQSAPAKPTKALEAPSSDFLDTKKAEAPVLSSHWVANLVSYRQDWYANQKVAEFSRRGIAATVMPVDVKGETWYLLRATGFASQEQALNYAEKAKKTLNLTSVLVTQDK